MEFPHSKDVDLLTLPNFRKYSSIFWMPDFDLLPVMVPLSKLGFGLIDYCIPSGETTIGMISIG
jgi:hypothetical protein